MPVAVRSAVSPRVALVLLLSINLMNYVDRQILSAVEEPIGREFGVSADKTGWLPTAFMLAYMVFAPLFGVLADRTSRWLIVGGGVIAWSLASGGSGAVSSFSMLLVMRLLIGVGEAAYGPVAPTLIADFYPVERRGQVMAWFYAAIPVGSAIGYVIGGLLHAHWHWAFYLTLPPGVALGVWALCLRDPRHVPASAAVVTSSEAVAPANWVDPLARPVVAAAPPARSRPAEYAALLRNRSYVLVTVGMTGMTFAVGGIQFFMPRWLVDRGLSPWMANTGLGAVVAAAGLIATLAGGWAGDRLRRRYSGSYFLVSGVAMGLAFPLFLLMLVTPFPACWAVLFATVFCLFFNTGPSNTIIANVTAPGVRATAFALNIFFIHLLGDAISPPIIGYVAKHFGGLDHGFLVVGGTIVLAAVAWIAGARFLEADTARAEPQPAVSVAAD